MRCKSLLAGVLGLMAVIASSGNAAAQEFVMDTSHAHVGFGVKHFTVSTVRGVFNDYQATVDYDAEDPAESSVEVTIQAASIDTRHQRRDDHLRSEDFLDAENHPEITFSSTSVAETDGGFDVTGDLTIRGVTKEVVLPVEVLGPITDPLGLQRMGVSGELTIDRKEFGVAWNRTMETGGLFVGEEVTISIEGEFTFDPSGGSE